MHDRVAELVVRRTQVAVRGLIDPRAIEAHARLDDFTDNLAVQLVAYLACNTIHREVMTTERIPASWWDGFKLAWFPRWALRRWPAKERVIESEVQFVHMCPHLPHFDANQSVHAVWLTSPEDLRRSGLTKGSVR
jgi:hypothetical protein